MQALPAERLPQVIVVSRQVTLDREPGEPPWERVTWVSPSPWAIPWDGAIAPVIAAIRAAYPAADADLLRDGLRAITSAPDGGWFDLPLGRVRSGHAMLSVSIMGRRLFELEMDGKEA